MTATKTTKLTAPEAAVRILNGCLALMPARKGSDWTVVNGIAFSAPNAPLEITERVWLYLYSPRDYRVARGKYGSTVAAAEAR